ncbi:Protein Aster-B [Blomia tropicalis]|nr:Protein Aster-B [Blomia tropicalis]
MAKHVNVLYARQDVHCVSLDKTQGEHEPLFAPNKRSRPQLMEMNHCVRNHVLLLNYMIFTGFINKSNTDKYGKIKMSFNQDIARYMAAAAAAASSPSSSSSSSPMSNLVPNKTKKSHKPSTQRLLSFPSESPTRTLKFKTGSASSLESIVYSSEMLPADPETTCSANRYRSQISTSSSSGSSIRSLTVGDESSSSIPHKSNGRSHKKNSHHNSSGKNYHSKRSHKKGKKNSSAGRIYLAINYIAFYSNILGYETIVTLPYRDIKSINKATTIKLFPNAIEVVTNDGLKYFFTSFVSRDRAFKVMKLLWLNAISLQPTDRIEWSVICKLIQESYAISNVNLNKLEDSDLEDDLLKGKTVRKQLKIKKERQLEETRNHTESISTEPSSSSLELEKPEDDDSDISGSLLKNTIDDSFDEVDSNANIQTFRSPMPIITRRSRLWSIPDNIFHYFITTGNWITSNIFNAFSTERQFIDASGGQCLAEFVRSTSNTISEDN